MCKISFTGYIKSKWPLVLILLAKRSQNAYPSLQVQLFSSEVWKDSLNNSWSFLPVHNYLRKLGKIEECSISSDFCFCTKINTANLITSKLSWTHKLWLFIIYKPVMYLGISSETLWCPPCHPPLPLPLCPLFCPFGKYWSFLQEGPDDRFKNLCCWYWCSERTFPGGFKRWREVTEMQNSLSNWQFFPHKTALHIPPTIYICTKTSHQKS